MSTSSTHTTPDGAAVTPHPSDADPLEHADPDVLLPTSTGGTLAGHGSLVDADGEDIRQYTGEPVETDDGWVIPQAQTIGAVDEPADTLAASDANPPSDTGGGGGGGAGGAGAGTGDGAASRGVASGPDADKPRPSEQQAQENRELDPPA